MGSVAWLDDQRRRRQGSDRDGQVLDNAEQIAAGLTEPPTTRAGKQANSAKR